MIELTAIVDGIEVRVTGDCISGVVNEFYGTVGKLKETNSLEPKCWAELVAQSKG